jgi:ribonuclease HI
MQWNCNGYRSQYTELKNYLHNVVIKPDIICLQETFLKAPHTVNLYGYSIIRNDREDRPKGGVATFIKNGINYRQIDGPNDLECICVEIYAKKESIKINNIYIPPEAEISEDSFKKLFTSKSTIVTGDMNGYSALWGHSGHNRIGRMIEDVVDEMEYVVLNSGEPTYQGHNGNMSALDITVASMNIAAKCSWTVHENTLGSDHLPTVTTISEIRCNDETKEEKFNMKKADWKEFISASQQRFEQIQSEDDVEQFAFNIETAIIEAAKASIPVTNSAKCKIKSVPYWDQDCSEIIRERNKARNRANKHKLLDDCIEYRRLKGVAQNTLKRKAREHWTNYCDTLTDATKLSSVWRMAKGMNGVNTHSDIPGLSFDGRSANTSEEKANMLADTFERHSSDSNYSIKFAQHKARCEADVTFAEDNSAIDARDTPMNQLYSLHELKSALDQVKKSTAPGMDKIQYELMKKLPIAALNKLLSLYNTIWIKGVIPASWKHAEILPFRKPGKPKSDPSSYRPISLTTVLCKCMERMVNNRLTWFIEENKLFNVAQTGFRKNKSTVDQLLKLQDTILKQIKNRGSVLGVFLDFEKAYDMLWTKGMLEKIKKLNINGTMYSYIKDFINNRTFHVRVGSSRSSNRKLQNGTPQGSVISPTLFLLMINDMKTETADVELSLYADDSATYTGGRDIDVLGRRMQKSLNAIENWCDKSGFKVSPSKSTAVIFSNKKVVRLKEPLTLNGSIIKIESQVKFLGMIFDQKLIWDKHAEYIVDKCKARLNLMRSVSGSKFGANKKALLTMYRTLIRSLIDYGSIVYDSASKTIKEKIDGIQNRALKICTRATHGTAAIILQNECGEMPLAVRRKKLQLEYTARVKSDRDHPSAAIIKDHWALHYGNYKTEQEPFAVKVNRVYDKEKWTNIQQRINPKPPWNHSKIQIDISLKEERIKQKTQTATKALTRRHIESFVDQIKIFTDASKSSEGVTAAAIYIPEYSFEKSIRLSDNASVYTCELLAIKLAVEWITADQQQNNRSANRQIAIFSDSLGAVSALRHKAAGKESLLIQEIKEIAEMCAIERLTITWIPSHIDIEENDRVDKLAKEGLSHRQTEQIIEVDAQEMIAKIEAYCTKVWQKQYEKSKNGKFYKTLQPTVSKKIKYMNNNRKKDVTITKLRSGKCRLNKYLYDFGKHENGLCDSCGVPETVEHFLIHCENSELKNKIQEKCEQLEIDFNFKNALTNEEIIDSFYEMIDREI